MDAAILDTDILSEILKGRDQIVRRYVDQYRLEHRELTITSLSVLEIVKGFAKRRREDLIESFLGFAAAEIVVPLDIEAATIAGRIYAKLEQAGQTIGRIDPIIAAIALKLDLPLITGNMDHYLRVRHLGFKLRLIYWRVSANEV